MPQVIFTLTVDYTPNGVPLKDLARMGEDSIRRAIGDGGLTGESEAEVELWTLDVSKREDGECPRCGSLPGRRDETCPECTNADGTAKR